MKKIIHEVETPAPVPDDDEQGLARIVPIRTDTTFPRLPVHRISKKTPVKIKHTKQSERGKTITTWEVKHPPGPLGYKIDTLIVNRRIDEMRNKGEIRKIIKLGSLIEICEELGMVVSGRTANQIKEALKENAGALINAQLDYKGKDGREKDFGFSSARYGIIFTGEKLPNGKRADAVHIVLHDIYLAFLQHSITRPLDYKYLKKLAPSAQRFYELLSFHMFGALMHNRPNVQMLYSEFCEAAPLTRHYDAHRMRSQMRKIHIPHLKEGYIKSVEFEETLDFEGRIDWVMKYIPGRKARHEHKEFTQKKLAEEESPKPRLVSAPKAEAKANEPAEKKIERPASNPEDLPLIEKLVSFGIGHSRAVKLVNNHREAAAIWADAWPHQNKKGMENPPAVLISFIEKGDNPLPKGYKEARERKEPQKVEQARRTQQPEDDSQRTAQAFYERHFAPQFKAFQRQELDVIEHHHPEAFREFKQWFDKNCRLEREMLENEHLRQLLVLQNAQKFFNEMRPKFGLQLATFSDWDMNYNSNRCEPQEWCSKNALEVLKMMESR